MPLLFEQRGYVGEGLEGFQALVNEPFPLGYLAAVCFGAELCQRDLALVDSYETEIFRLIS